MWFPSYLTLPNHPKTKRAARALGIPRPHVVGLLNCLWGWAFVYAPDGVLTDDPEDIAEEAQWDGDANLLIESLVAAGFLDTIPDSGGWRIHDWHEHAGRFAQELAQRKADGQVGNHLRWHVQRGVTAPDCHLCVAPDRPPISPPESQGDSPPDKARKQAVLSPPESQSRAEQSREQQKTLAKQAAKPIPEDLPRDLVRAVATEHADRRIADNYQVDNRAKFINHLMKTEAVQHEARRRMGFTPSDELRHLAVVQDIEEATA